MKKQSFLDRLKKQPEKYEKMILFLRFGMVFVNIVLVLGFFAFLLFLIYRK